MRLTLCALTGAVLSLTLLAPAARAEEDHPLYRLGVSLCGTTISERPEGVDLDSYLPALAAAGVSQEDFCACVGGAFMGNAPEQSKTMAAAKTPEEEAAALLRLVDLNMYGCVPQDGELAAPRYTIDTLYDGLPADPDDIRVCGEVIAGDFPARGFDPKAVATAIRAEEYTTDQVCNCTARYISWRGDTLQKQIEQADSPGNAWGEALGAGVKNCLGLF